MKLFSYLEASEQVIVMLSKEEAKMLIKPDEIKRIENRDVVIGEELESKLE
jgi:hypothetical protein